MSRAKALHEAGVSVQPSIYRSFVGRMHQFLLADMADCERRMLRVIGTLIRVHASGLMSVASPRRLDDDIIEGCRGAPGDSLIGDTIGDGKSCLVWGPEEIMLLGRSL